MNQSGPSLNQIDNKPLREKVLDVLREAIIQGDFKPGQALVESDLATRLGVSRAPIREALQVLSADGLLDVIPYHGTTVRALTKTDIEELYSLRSVLEVFAMRRVVARGDPEIPRALRQVYEDMLDSAHQGDLKQVNLIDRRFHDTLIEMSGHRLLAVVWNSVSMRVRQVMGLLNERNTDLKQIAYNHVPLIEAIERGDEEQAVALLRHHIAASGDLIAEGWVNTGEQGPP
jgi:DNA-binding GntR family transcriptional regulator